MKIVVTGSAGYVGSTLCADLLARGHQVVGVDSLMHGGEAMLGFINNPAFTFIRGDLRDADVVARAVEGADAVVHLAAIVGDPACNVDPDETINLNYTATKILVDACNLYGVRRLVFASSCSVYGASAH